MNWDKYKFHCSALPTLMTAGRSKEALLSETAKAKLLEIWIEERFGRRKLITSKYMDKGIAVESDSLELVSKVTKRNLFKNLNTLENDYLIGTPDVIKPSLIDIKSSWDIWTYFSVTEKDALKSYDWQLKGYMLLTGTKKAELVYALVDTPLHITEEELYRMHFKVGEEKAEEYRNNYEFSDIPENLRVKSFDIKLEKDDEENLKNKVMLWREYLAKLDEETK